MNCYIHDEAGRKIEVGFPPLSNGFDSVFPWLWMLSRHIHRATCSSVMGFRLARIVILLFYLKCMFEWGLCGTMGQKHVHKRRNGYQIVRDIEYLRRCDCIHSRGCGLVV